MKIQSLGDAALLVTLADAPGVQASQAVHAFAAAVQAADVRGVRALIPAYTTLLVQFDPDMTAPEALTAALTAIAPTATPPARRRWTVPVTYDGADLLDVAAALNLSVDRVIDLHASTEYAVACLGFAPGFAYLSGLPEALHIPRRPSPRAQIAAGSLILGGQQTAVMPLAMPSGWHVLGRTCVSLFRVDRDPPCLLLPGDAVVFVPTAALDLPRADARCEVLQ